MIRAIAALLWISAPAVAAPFTADDAVAAAQEHLRAGLHWVVDLDIEEFFDHVDHVRLMLRLGQRVNDAGLLDLIADFLRAGMRHEDGTVEPTSMGIAQGSPLSPLLANIVLDELDQEYTRFGWPFVRYADDCILLAGSEAEGRAMLDFTAGFLADRLRLRLHPRKTRLVQPADAAFLGFTYRLSRYGQVSRHITRQALQQFHERIRQLARPEPGQNFKEVITRVGAFVRGWSIYYGFCEDQTLDVVRSFARAQLRACAWELWRKPAERRRQLIRHGVPEPLADAAANALVLPDQVPDLPVLAQAFPNKWFEFYGLGEKGPRPKRKPAKQKSSSTAKPQLATYLTSAEFRQQIRQIAAALAASPSAATPMNSARSALASLATMYGRIRQLLGAERLPDLPELANESPLPHGVSPIANPKS